MKFRAGEKGVDDQIYYEFLCEQISVEPSLLTKELFDNKFYPTDTREENFVKKVDSFHNKYIQRYYRENESEKYVGCFPFRGESVLLAIVVLCLEDENPAVVFKDIVYRFGMNVTSLKEIDRSCDRFCENVTDAYLV